MSERIFTLVKTYPTLSSQYDELVCTAGLRENGQWVRIYPVPFRKLDWGNRYTKYQWIRVSLRKNEADPRPESFRPASDIEPLEKIDTKHGWAARREILSQIPIYNDMAVLIEDAQHGNRTSLALFKPRDIAEFCIEETTREWAPDKIHRLEERAKQLALFQDRAEFVREFKSVRKVPYKFLYRFFDKNGRESRMMIADWEIGALFWNCLKSADGNEQIALQKVRQKCEIELPAKDLHLILGTTRQFHDWAKNPFIIIGLYYPPHRA